MNAIEIYREWLSSGKLNEQEIAELKAIEGNEDEIRERFFDRLHFGTGGLRGTMKTGLRNMNRHTVAHATQGLANRILSFGYPVKPVVVGYDCRNNSEIFARTTACVLAANHIPVYLFDNMRPTPELSFALRELHCVAGVNITASHNPKEYNGYKVYWEDGAQLSPEDAEAVACEMKKTDLFQDVRITSYESAVKSGSIQLIGAEIDEAYLEKVREQAINPSIVSQVADRFKIIYSPIHGTGYQLVPEILRRIGLKNLYSVPEQSIPDGDFPTVEKPNPEYLSTFERGIRLANEVGGDLIIATDPDADRMGAVARARNGSFVPISGNQMGALLLNYILNAYEETGGMPLEPYAVKTIVTSELISKICAAHHVTLYQVLTGFKFIGEVIKQKERTGHGSFLFGAEESYGYLKGTYTRDKDAVVAAMLVCEMAAYYQSRGMTLADALEQLWDAYGYSAEQTDEFYFAGVEGENQIKAIMQAMRWAPSVHFGGVEVQSTVDYLTGVVTGQSKQEPDLNGMPRSDVISFRLCNGDIIIARPSGTEPKIKFYYLVSSATRTTAQNVIGTYRQSIQQFIEAQNLGTGV